MNRVGWFLLPPLMLLAGMLGFYSRSWLDDPDEVERRPIVGEPRPPLRLPDLSHAMRDLGEWDGRVVLLNFWASWCLPCRKEVPDLVALQTELGERGLQVVGIAIDDRADADEFAEKYGINYPILVTDWLKAAAAMEAYGNRTGVLPYTVIINRERRVAFAHRGLLPKARAMTELTDAGL